METHIPSRGFHGRVKSAAALCGNRTCKLYLDLGPETPRILRCRRPTWRSPRWSSAVKVEVAIARGQPLRSLTRAEDACRITRVRKRYFVFIEWLVRYFDIYQV